MKVAIIGDSITMTTGYATDSLIMLKGLQKRGHEVVDIGLQYIGNPFEYDGIEVRAGNSTADIERSIKATKPDYVIHFRDAWIYTGFGYEQYTLIDRVHKYGAKLINMTPADMQPMPKVFIDAIKEEGDFTLFATKWATDYFKSIGVDNVDYIPNGVQEGIRPIEVNKAHRPLEFPSGTMMMNVGYAVELRKLTPLVMLLLKKYVPYDRTAFAYLHTQVRSYFLNDMIQEMLGLGKGRVLYSQFNDGKSTLHGYSPDTLNTLYNMSDVYCNFASREGFGKTELEAASLGIPVLVSDFPVHREVLSNYPSVHFVKAPRILPSPWTFEYFADMDNALEIMLDLKDKGFPRSKPHVEKEHTHEYIAEKLEKVLEGI